LVKIAAVADLHCTEDSRNVFKPIFSVISQEADILLLPGDLTRYGRPSEARTLIDELSVLNIPAFAVLGNHDHHSSEERQLIEIFNESCVVMLDGEIAEIKIRYQSVGIVGAKGFGGGFGIRALPEFGEEILKLFYRTTADEAKKIEEGLTKTNADIKIVMLHYSPIPETLLGEPSEIYAFLGSSFLGDAVDKHGADVIIHGHAHFGSEEGITPSGIPVRNVSLPMLGRPYALFEVDCGRKVVTLK
jgi:Icc-related predicted phosphoesterase